jgi:hypothetical protein
MNASIMVIEFQWVCSFLSQILGLDNEKHVAEVMLGFLLTFFKSKSGPSVCNNFDQFIADNIHKQLVNFSSLRHFRYYTYLLKIFPKTNKREFHQFIADNIHKQLVNFSSLRHFRYYTYLLKIFPKTNKREFPEATFVIIECKRITFLIFINKVMSTVYNLIFNTSLPRVLDDMRSYL